MVGEIRVVDGVSLVKSWRLVTWEGKMEFPYACGVAAQPRVNPDSAGVERKAARFSKNPLGQSGFSACTAFAGDVIVVWLILREVSDETKEN